MVHRLAQTSITSTDLIPSLGVAEIYSCQTTHDCGPDTVKPGNMRNAHDAGRTRVATLPENLEVLLLGCDRGVKVCLGIRVSGGTCSNYTNLTYFSTRHHHLSNHVFWRNKHLYIKTILKLITYRSEIERSNKNDHDVQKLKWKSEMRNVLLCEHIILLNYKIKIIVQMFLSI